MDATTISALLTRIAATQDGNPVRQLRELVNECPEPRPVCDNLNQLIVEIVLANLAQDGLSTEGIIADFIYCAVQLTKAARTPGLAAQRTDCFLIKRVSDGLWLTDCSTGQFGDKLDAITLDAALVQSLGYESNDYEAEPF